MVFTFFNGWEKIESRIIFYNTWKLYKFQISVFMNKVLLEHSHTRSFTYHVYGWVPYNDRVESELSHCNRALCRKSLASPCMHRRRHIVNEGFPVISDYISLWNCAFHQWLHAHVQWRHMWNNFLLPRKRDGISQNNA